MQKIPTKWRELSKKERFKIPSKTFNINEKEIEKIRKINDPKTRLIKSARLQYELFGEIHSYLTVWIAGYGSDAMIRQKFGSTQNLLDLFFKPLKFPKEVSCSWADVKRRIKIPEEMTEELAEETGIHIGDGSIHISLHKNWRSYQYSISGDLINEILYHENHIKKLIRKIYNLLPSIIKRSDKNSIETKCRSKSIVEFKNKILKLPLGSKKNISIPTNILKNNEFQKKCVSGIIDTDFNITSNMAISGKMNNLFVTKALTKILKLNEIKHIYTEYKDYGRFYIQKQGAIKIINDWKLNNPKHTSKYELFKEFGVFIPFSTTPERLAVLQGKLEIEDLKKICKKRRAPVKTKKSYVTR